MTAPPDDRRRNGFTLLEVLVAMVLLAGLTASSLVAISRYQVTLKTLAEKQHAIEIADQLMQGWMDSEGGLPTVSVGVVASSPEFRFRTHILSQRLVCGVAADVVRLEIWKSQINSTLNVPTQPNLVPDQFLVQLDYLRPSRRF